MGAGGRPAGRAGRRRVVVLVMLVALYPVLVGFGDSPEGRNRKGNRFYRDGRFDEALTEYRGAQVLAPELAALALNAGNALFRKGELPDAIREYGNAALSDDVEMTSAALYNAGNAFLQAGQMDTAVEAFKGALKLSPDDQDAKHNLEVALKLREQQEQAMSQEEAERLLDAIEDAEEELQAKLRAAKARKREKVDKDW